MNICVVNPFFSPYDGGIERRIKNVGKILSENHNYHVVTSQLPGTEREETVDGMNVRRLPSRFFDVYNPPFVFTEGIREEIVDLDPDLLHFHYRWSFKYSKEISSFIGELPVIFTWHNDFGEGSGWQRPLSLLNDIFFKHYIGKEFDRVICISEYIKKQLQNRGFSSDNLEVIYNGIEPKEKSSEEEDFILFVGRLVQTKGLDVLAEAVGGTDVNLKVCGKGPQAARLERLENVELLGYVSEERKNRLLKRCKFLVLPSEFESFGIVLLEAMAYGKPVVATRVGGIPEVVGDAGRLVAPNDPNDLRARIRELLSNDELRRKLGERAWRRAKKFSWKKIARGEAELYEKVLSDF